MPTLPTPGADRGTWGDELNEYLTDHETRVDRLESGVFRASALTEEIASFEWDDAGTYRPLVEIRTRKDLRGSGDEIGRGAIRFHDTLGFGLVPNVFPDRVAEIGWYAYGFGVYHEGLFEFFTQGLSVRGFADGVEQPFVEVRSPDDSSGLRFRHDVNHGRIFTSGATPGPVRVHHDTLANGGAGPSVNILETKGQPSMTANHYTALNNADATVAAIRYDGAAQFGTGGFSAGAGAVNARALYLANYNTPAEVVAVVNGMALQTGDLIQGRLSDGTVRFQVSAAGAVSAYFSATGSVKTLELGAADSGGSGYRAVRVTN